MDLADTGGVKAGGFAGDDEVGLELGDAVEALESVKAVASARYDDVEAVGKRPG